MSRKRSQSSPSRGSAQDTLDRRKWRANHGLGPMVPTPVEEGRGVPPAAPKKEGGE